MESCDNGDRDTNTEAATTQKITATLLACLEHVLLDKPSVSQSVISEPRSENETSKTWKPGKVAEIMERFRKGELVVVETSKGANVNNSVMSLAVAHIPSKSSSTRPNVNCDQASEKVSSVRRPFRPPSRRPVIENPSDDESCQNSVVGSRSTDVQKPVSQGLFTTHAQVSSSSSSSNFPTTTFNFQAGHKRFHSNARSFLEKRSCKIRSKLPRDEEDEEMPQPSSNLSTYAKAAEAEISTSRPFRSAYEFMITEDMARGIKRSLPPPTASQNKGSGHKIPKIAAAATKNGNDEGLSDNPEVNLLMLDERLKNVEPKMVEAILNEVVELGASTDWNDIAGLEGVKAIIREIIIWPMQRPDLFTGLRGPPKGILLFGPPGTGKTMFGRLIATKSSSTFFNISASSLMSKWCGDGEKMVRALFQVARVKQPSVVFIDEIDSILTQRSDSEHETSRRLKTEFLLQFDGCGTKSDDKLLVIGVSNRPQELDEAARRRLVKRIYIPLPEPQGRRELVRNLLADQQTSFTEEDYDKVVSLTEGYSGADMASLCKEASYGPIRDIGHDILQIEVASIRPIQFSDFEHAVKRVKASVDPKDLMQFESWDQQFGCHV